MGSIRDKYVTLYYPAMSLVTSGNINTISNSDIVSISFIHNYDTMTHPIIRLRLYSDISLIQTLCDDPDNIEVRGVLTGGIYKMNDDMKSPELVSWGKEISFRLKGYIENKNIPTSVYDQYKDGIKVSSDINDNVKVPIEVYCYNDRLIHYMKQKSPSIYKNMSLTSIISDMLSRNDIYDFHIDPLHNQTKYKQVLIPNLNLLDSIAFFDQKYGMYKKGAQVYGDLDKLKICDTGVTNTTKPIPIYVESGKSNNDMTGMKYIGDNFQLTTMAGNVSVKTETDIERVLNGPNLAAINLSTMKVTTEELKDLFSDTSRDNYLRKIETPDILFKSASDYVASSYVARLNENITEVDVSGSGFDISRMTVETRYNLIFASPMRGIDIGRLYRASYVCHVLTNLDANLFSAQTTMNLRTN